MDNRKLKSGEYNIDNRYIIRYTNLEKMENLILIIGTQLDIQNWKADGKIMRYVVENLFQIKTETGSRN